MTIAAPGFADRTSAVPGIGAGADAPDRGAGDAEVIGGELGAGGTKLALPATRDGAGGFGAVVRRALGEGGVGVEARALVAASPAAGLNAQGLLISQAVVVIARAPELGEAAGGVSGADLLSDGEATVEPGAANAEKEGAAPLVVLPETFPLAVPVPPVVAAGVGASSAVLNDATVAAAAGLAPRDVELDARAGAAQPRRVGGDRDVALAAESPARAVDAAVLGPPVNLASLPALALAGGAAAVADGEDVAVSMAGVGGISGQSSAAGLAPAVRALDTGVVEPGAATGSSGDSAAVVGAVTASIAAPVKRAAGEGVALRLGVPGAATGAGLDVREVPFATGAAVGQAPVLTRGSAPKGVDRAAGVAPDLRQGQPVSAVPDAAPFARIAAQPVVTAAGDLAGSVVRGAIGQVGPDAGASAGAVEQPARPLALVADDGTVVAGVAVGLAHDAGDVAALSIGAGRPVVAGSPIVDGQRLEPDVATGGGAGMLVAKVAATGPLVVAAAVTATGSAGESGAPVSVARANGLATGEKAVSSAPAGVIAAALSVSASVVDDRSATRASDAAIAGAAGANIAKAPPTVGAAAVTSVGASEPGVAAPDAGRVVAHRTADDAAPVAVASAPAGIEVQSLVTPALRAVDLVQGPQVVPAALAVAPAPAIIAPVAIASPVVLPVQPDSLAHDVGLALVRQLGGNGDELRIRLEPADFGTIDIRMTFDHRGALRAVVGADSALALDLLRRDSADLGRAMSDAGVHADAESFRFESRSQERGDGGQRQHRPDTQPHDALADDGAGEMPDPTRFRPLRWRGAVDVMA
jgi:flagellar hook-length control protein FliK